jgi:hypothetical protein
MKRAMKAVVLGVVPAACGAAAVPAFAEKIDWAERPSVQLSFLVAAKATGPVTVRSDVEAQRAEIRAALQAREAEIELLRARLKAEPEITIVNGVRP